MADKYTGPILQSSALLTIDVQRDFTEPGAVAEIAGTQDRVPAMRRILEAYRRRSWPIIHVVRLYLADGSNADVCRRQAIEAGNRAVSPGSPGAELVDPLKPDPKLRFDANALLWAKCRSSRKMSGRCTNRAGMPSMGLLWSDTCGI